MKKFIANLIKHLLPPDHPVFRIRDMEVKLHVESLEFKSRIENLEKREAELETKLGEQNSEFRSRIENLEKRNSELETNLRENIDKRLVKLVHDVYGILPQEISGNERTEKTICEFIKIHKIDPSLNMVVSKNDLMFQYSLYHLKSLTGAYSSYLSIGLNGARIIRKLAKRKFGDLKKANSILDFASGYGRLTRFLVLETDPDKIWVSDIKEQANDFQEKQFGVHGVSSTYIPEEFKPGRKFDLIFVASLFSHLPEDTFRRWLKVLFDLITDRGVLAFTVHDMRLEVSGTPGEFKYFESNEDLLFYEVEDIIEDKTKYGITFVTDHYMNALFESLGIGPMQHYRYEKALGQHQDMYVVTKEQGIFDGSLDFNEFP